MAIVKMSRFTLFAFKKDKESLLEKLQKFEGVQFINLQENVKEEDNALLQKDSEEIKASDIEGDQARVKLALDFLNRHLPKDKGMKVLMAGKRSLTYDELSQEAKKLDYLQVAEQIRSIDQKLSFTKSEVGRLETEIATVIPWQKFDAPIEQIKNLTYTKTYLGSIPLNLKEKFKQEFSTSIKTAYVENVSDVKDAANFFMIVHKEVVTSAEDLLKKYGFAEANLGFEGTCMEQIQKLQQRIDQYKSEIEETIVRIGQYKEQIPNLEVGYEYLSKEAIKARSTTNFLKTNHLVVIEGWVTQENCDVLKSTIEEVTKNHYHIELKEPEDSEDVPILLKNNRLVAPFESFISMYGLPKYKGIDPTLAIVPFYMLFYGLMLSDAIYGLIQFIGCAVLLKLFNLGESTKNMVKLFLYLSIPTMFVGVLYGSYFSGAIKIPPIWMDPTKQVILVLLFSFGIGLIHIFTGLSIKAYMLIRDGHVLDAFYDVGLWMITLISSLLLLAASFGKIEALQGILPITKYMMFAGMIGLVLTQGRANKGILAKLGAGIYGLYGITGYIGDMVSYSRLMALGLATSFIGGAFNSMIDLLGTGVAAWIFGPIIFVVGHLFNLFINALGAYVHSLRLQYLEYFGKFYDSGGKPFTPFKAKSKFINIIK